MRLSLVFVSFILFTSFGSNKSSPSNTNEKTALSASKITFLGVNYSKFKLINSEGFIDKNGKTKCKALSFKYFESWNDVFVIEARKFNLVELLKIEEVEVSLKETLKLNSEIETEECLIQNGSYSISESEILDIVSSYGDDLGGISVLIIGESISKKNGYGIYHIVYIDSEKNILFTNRYEAKPYGSGFDNYWVNTIFDTLEQHARLVKKKRKSLGIK